MVLCVEPRRSTLGRRRRVVGGIVASVFAAGLAAQSSAGSPARAAFPAGEVAGLCAYFEALAFGAESHARPTASRAATDCRAMERARRDRSDAPEVIAASDVYLGILAQLRAEIVTETVRAYRSGAVRPSSLGAGRALGLPPGAIEAIARHSRAGYGRRVWTNTIDGLAK